MNSVKKSYPVLLSKRSCKTRSGICTISAIVVQLNSSLKARPSLPPRFLTFFKGNVEKNSCTLRKGKTVCLLGLLMPYSYKIKGCSFLWLFGKMEKKREYHKLVSPTFYCWQSPQNIENQFFHKLQRESFRLK